MPPTASSGTHTEPERVLDGEGYVLVRCPHTTGRGRVCDALLMRYRPGLKGTVNLKCHRCKTVFDLVVDSDG